MYYIGSPTVFDLPGMVYRVTSLPCGLIGRELESRFIKKEMTCSADSRAEGQSPISRRHLAMVACASCKENSRVRFENKNIFCKFEKNALA
jgi:hypothetical protein